ncbi:hypothetical protein MAR_022671 [Mya arenaria]|uniref:Uncharacterized protein n=1 Tax=Mya arenaria TaxID=6604 RepID=A0ABY7DMB1_MYAAR|nr:hypothetical protein MAR_022671 [Mya arenaria]
MPSSFTNSFKMGKGRTAGDLARHFIIGNE